ncbi:MAG: OmpH family outer membrane protein [Bacteroidetes bacterium]|nr:OmpH family outer membrane protein [Bacteroidota bacterium]
MKNYLILFSLLIGATVLAQAQPKSGHINLEELVNLMPARDSATVKFQKYVTEMQDMYDAIQTEYNTKANEYQQKNASWSAAILETKQRELVEMRQRLEQFGESAGQEMQSMQTVLFSPVYTEANEAIKKIAKELGLIYVFNSAGMPYIDEEQSINLLDKAKVALKIPAEKVAPTVIGQ